MNDKVSHHLLHGFGPLFVDKAVRQKEYGIIARMLRAGKPLQEGRALRNFERRVGNDALAAEVNLMKLHPQCGSIGI
ncbi:hypothetical protein OSL50_27210, partial [Escherichia coli]|nr:hypothetical protein [Escherichia coli]